MIEDFQYLLPHFELTNEAQETRTMTLRIWMQVACGFKLESPGAGEGFQDGHIEEAVRHVQPSDIAM